MWMSEPGRGETIEAISQKTCTDPVGDKVIKKDRHLWEKIGQMGQNLFLKR